MIQREEISPKLYAARKFSFLEVVFSIMFTLEH